MLSKTWTECKHAEQHDQGGGGGCGGPDCCCTWRVQLAGPARWARWARAPPRLGQRRCRPWWSNAAQGHEACGRQTVMRGALIAWAEVRQQRCARTWGMQACEHTPGMRSVHAAARRGCSNATSRPRPQHSMFEALCRGKALPAMPECCQASQMHSASRKRVPTRGKENAGQHQLNCSLRVIATWAGAGMILDSKAEWYKIRHITYHRSWNDVRFS